MADHKLITIEEHFTDQKVIEANAKFSPSIQLTPEQQKIKKFFMSRMMVGPELMDTDEKRIVHMDNQGIEMQILSYTSPVSDHVPAPNAVDICKMANDIMAEHISRHPDRFRGMATLPMADPDAAATELERTVKELGFVGTMICGQWQGHWYDEPQFFSIFEIAAELGIPVYFHPALINPMIMNYYYMSPSYSPIVGAEFSSAAFGWHVDTGIAVVRMILSGVFDKLPALKIISGHWGEDIPMFLDRMTHQLPPELTGLKKNILEYYRNNIHITPSGIMSKINLETMVKYLGADRIIYAEDYPYEQPSNFASFLWDSDLTDEEKYLIAKGNAERVYNLKDLQI